MRKIGIIGSAESTYKLAPWDDPEWELWGLSWRCLDHPRFDRIYEVHNPDTWHLSVDPAIYGPWLKDPKDNTGRQVQVWMLPHLAPHYNAHALPVAEFEAIMGVRRYFTSSFSYMLAHALLEGVDEIGIWGVDLIDDEEYTRQRPCAEYLLGMAHARGIKITIPPQSALLKNGYVYGLETSDSLDSPLERRLKEKLTDYRAKVEQRRTEIAQLEGAIHEVDKTLEWLRAERRGLCRT